MKCQNFRFFKDTMFGYISDDVLNFIQNQLLSNGHSVIKASRIRGICHLSSENHEKLHSKCVSPTESFNLSPSNSCSFVNFIQLLGVEMWRRRITYIMVMVIHNYFIVYQMNTAQELQKH